MSHPQLLTHKHLNGKMYFKIHNKSPFCLIYLFNGYVKEHERKHRFKDLVMDCKNIILN
jgi:hypothetical protein